MKKGFKRALRRIALIPLVLTGLSCSDYPLRPNLETKTQDIEQEFLGKLNPQQRKEAERRMRNWDRSYLAKPSLKEILEADRIEQLNVERSVWLGLRGDNNTLQNGQSFKVDFDADLYGISAVLENDEYENQGVRPANETDELRCDIMRLDNLEVVATSRIKAFRKGTRWVNFPFSAVLEKRDYLLGISLEGCQMGCGFSNNPDSYPAGEEYRRSTENNTWQSSSPYGTGDMAFRVDLLERSPDFDRDGDVDFKDFLRFAQHYGELNNWNPRYDLDMNGRVDFGDYTRFAGSYGKKIEYSSKLK